jgi:hypothetical protein
VNLAVGTRWTPTVVGLGLILAVFVAVSVEVAHDNEKSAAARRADAAEASRVTAIRSATADAVHRTVTMPTTYVIANSYGNKACGSYDLGCWDDPSESPQVAATSLRAALLAGGVTVRQAVCTPGYVTCRVFGAIGATRVDYLVSAIPTSPGSAATRSQIAGFVLP